MDIKQNAPKSLALGAGAFIIWGIMPVYWKLLIEVPAYEIMANRVLWSFVFVMVLLFVTGKAKHFREDMRELWKSRKRFFCVVAAAFIVSFNWFVYIWAVNAGRLVECSLGYYINPLVNVLIGVTVLRERLSLWQFLAVLLAAAGVAKLTLDFGSFPWVALFLASSMGVYSLLKKIAGLGAIVGISIESAFTAPLAALFLGWLYVHGEGVPPGLDPTSLLLIGAGAATALPLLFFTYSITRLSLTIIGFLQYVQPSMTLALGVFIYDEAFTASHKAAFSFIWAAVLLFSLAKTSPMTALEKRLSRLFS